MIKFVFKYHIRRIIHTKLLGRLIVVILITNNIMLLSRGIEFIKTLLTFWTLKLCVAIHICQETYLV